MRSVNKVILIGNIVHDPETKQTSSGHSFTSFVIATNREWLSNEWENQSLAELHKIVAWWKLAELCWKFLKKWKFVYIEWYLKTKTWELDWKKMYRTEVVAQDMIMLNKKLDIDDSQYQDMDTQQQDQELETSKKTPDTPNTSKTEWWEMSLEWDDI